LRDLALEREQVLLRAVRLARKLRQLGGEPVHLARERVALSDQVERDLVVVPVDGDLELAAYADELVGLPLELLRELAAQVEDARGGLAQLHVAPEALVDGRLVDGVGVVVLAPTEPARREAADEVHGASEEIHGTSYSAVMPSSR